MDCRVVGSLEYRYCSYPCNGWVQIWHGDCFRPLDSGGHLLLVLLRQKWQHLTNDSRHPLDDFSLGKNQISFLLMVSLLICLKMIHFVSVFRISPAYAFQRWGHKTSRSTWCIAAEFRSSLGPVFRIPISSWKRKKSTIVKILDKQKSE